MRNLDRNVAAELFALLEPEEQAELARRLDNAEVVELLHELDGDDLAAVFEALPDPVSRRMRSLLNAVDRKRLDALMAWPQNSAGRNMNPECIRLGADLTVSAALEAIHRGAFDRDAAAVVCLQNADGCFAGAVPLMHVVSAGADTPLASLVEDAALFVAPNTPHVEAARRLRDWHLGALPVVDHDGHILGVLDRGDALDILEEFESELMYGKAGVAHQAAGKDMLFSRRLTSGSIWYPVRVRIAFLMVTLAGGFAVGGLIDTFEGTLEAVLVAAIFIPVIMDMGGNVGTQSTTIFARGFALGHITLGRFRAYLLRETSIGLTMGVFLGLIAGAAAYLWQGAPNGVPEIGAAVGISIVTVVTLGCVLGFVLPYIMVRMGLDHAPGADPFITTIKDFVGLSLYFVLVTWMIGVSEPVGACLVEGDPCTMSTAEACEEADGAFVEDVSCDALRALLAPAAP